MFVFKKKTSQSLEDPVTDKESYGDNEEEVLKNIRNKLKTPTGKVVPYQNAEEKTPVQKKIIPNNSLVDDFNHNEKEESLIEDIEDDDQYLEDEEDIIEEEEDSTQEEQLETNESTAEAEEPAELQESDDDIDEDIVEENADSHQEEQLENQENDETENDIQQEELIDDSDEEALEEENNNQNSEVELSEDEIDTIIEKQLEIQKKQEEESSIKNIITGNTAKQMQDKVGELLSTVKTLKEKPIVSNNIHDISLRELIEPILKEQIKIWIDNNLSTIVNNIVSSEIKRLLPDEHK